MERVLVLRVVGPSAVALQLETGVVVGAVLDGPLDLSRAPSALAPVPASVELGPFDLKTKQFVGCKLVVDEGEPPALDRTTQFRRLEY